MLKKNKIYRYHYLFLIAISILLTSCFNINDVEIKDIKEVKLVSFSDKGLIVDSKVKVLNPNIFEIKVIDSKIDVSVQGKAIGTSRIDGELILPSKSEEYHTLRLKSSFEDLGKDILVNLLSISAQNNKKIDFKFEGEIIGKVFLFKRKVNVSHTDSTVLKLF